MRSKILKRYVLLMMVVASPFTMLAQVSLEERSQKETTILKVQLQLDTTVYLKVLDTVRLYNQRIQDRIAVNEAQDAKQAAIRQLNKRKTIGIKQQLTQQQKDKYKADRDAMLARLRQTRPGQTFPDDEDNEEN